MDMQLQFNRERNTKLRKLLGLFYYTILSITRARFQLFGHQLLKCPPPGLPEEKVMKLCQSSTKRALVYVANGCQNKVMVCRCV